jgi:hypothetical protein
MDLKEGDKIASFAKVAQEDVEAEGTADAADQEPPTAPSAESGEQTGETTPHPNPPPQGVRE